MDDPTAPLFLPPEWRAQIAPMTSKCEEDELKYEMDVKGIRAKWRPQDYTVRRRALRMFLERRLRPLKFMSLRPDVGQVLRLEYHMDEDHDLAEFRVHVKLGHLWLDNGVSLHQYLLDKTHISVRMGVTVGRFFTAPHLPLLMTEGPIVLPKTQLAKLASILSHQPLTADSVDELWAGVDVSFFIF